MSQASEIHPNKRKQKIYQFYSLNLLYLKYNLINVHYSNFIYPHSLFEKKKQSFALYRLLKVCYIRAFHTWIC